MASRTIAQERRGGFSLVEVIVVMSTLFLLMGVLLIGAEATRVNAGFFKESNRFLGALIEARRQSFFTGQKVAAVPSSSGRCAYGMRFFDAGEIVGGRVIPTDGFVVFRDLAVGPCDGVNNNNRYDVGEEIQFFSLPRQVVQFQYMVWDVPRGGHGTVQNVVFTPGNGKILCDGGVCPGGGGYTIFVESGTSFPSGMREIFAVGDAPLKRRIVISNFGGISMDNL